MSDIPSAADARRALHLLTCYFAKTPVLDVPPDLLKRLDESLRETVRMK